MDYLDELFEADEPDDFGPLDLDGDEYDDEEDEDEDDDEVFVYVDDSYEEEDDEGWELGGFDDLKPFGSFDDGYGWDDDLF